MPVIQQPKSLRVPRFNGTPNNGNREPIAHAAFIQTNDATPTNNLLSPLSATTTITPLVSPVNAATITLIGAAAFQVSEDAAMSQFVTVPANVPITLEITRQAAVYVNTSTGTAAVSFFYQTI